MNTYTTESELIYGAYKLTAQVPLVITLLNTNELLGTFVHKLPFGSGPILYKTDNVAISLHYGETRLTPLNIEGLHAIESDVPRIFKKKFKAWDDKAHAGLCLDIAQECSGDQSLKDTLYVRAFCRKDRSLLMASIGSIAEFGYKDVSMSFRAVLTSDSWADITLSFDDKCKAHIVLVYKGPVGKICAAGMQAVADIFGYKIQIYKF